MLKGTVFFTENTRHGEAIRSGRWPVSREDIAALPFTAPGDIAENWKRFLCVPLDAVARMVTLSTSGTTGEPKRLAFSVADLERTLDFFAHGISVLVRPGDTVLVLLPGAERPDGVTDLLIQALPRIGARGVAGNPAAETAGFLAELERHRPDCLVAAPGTPEAAGCPFQRGTVTRSARRGVGAALELRGL